MEVIKCSTLNSPDKINGRVLYLNCKNKWLGHYECNFYLFIFYFIDYFICYIYLHLFTFQMISPFPVSPSSATMKVVPHLPTHSCFSTLPSDHLTSSFHMIKQSLLFFFLLTWVFLIYISSVIPFPGFRAKIPLSPPLLYGRSPPPLAALPPTL